MTAPAKVARWWHVSMAVVLVLAAAGLTVGAIWATGIPTYACDEGVPGQSAWIYAGLLLYPVCLITAAAVGISYIDMRPALQRVYIVFTLMEAGASVALVYYIASHYGHYQCG